MTEALVDIRKQPFYDGMLEACKSCLEQVWRGSWLIVEGYWKIGRVIIRYEEEGELAFQYGTGTMKALADDLGFRDPTLLYRMKEAAVKYPTKEALDSVKRRMVSDGRDPHWTNFRNYYLPSDTRNPDRYGGRDKVADNVMNGIESFLVKLEQLQEMYPELDNSQKQEAEGVFQKAVEIGHEALNLPYGKEEKPAKNEGYLDYIRSLPCCVDDTTPSVTHHIRKGVHGVAMKASDYFTVPLCQKHHDEIHNKGESFIEEWYGIDLWHEVAKCLMGYLTRLRG